MTPFLPERVEVVVEALRRALGIAAPLVETEVGTQYATRGEQFPDELGRTWEAAGVDARLVVATAGWFPDASGYVGGEQTFSVALFGRDDEPRGEVTLHLHQFAGWSSTFSVPPPIADALRAAGIAVHQVT